MFNVIAGTTVFGRATPGMEVKKMVEYVWVVMCWRVGNEPNVWIECVSKIESHAAKVAAAVEKKTDFGVRAKVQKVILSGSILR